ncbi:MFS monosaccharide transporter, putative [Penicillium digitatum Pd1]|uniref:MFS monosaccharide transporter, putative n=2 Tax=Penicillium digitatum TaxID=36651 RepID=K9FBA3_PEND1|nr:MFS monosaccharide transporter, putative [Penicillium digitatum Pd1]EKV06700.1 MFS monosaccharide transporter, putative [Penicillium digitatum Pd1]
MAPKYAGLSGKPLDLMVSTIATMGFLLFGYDQGVMSGIIDSDAFGRFMPITHGDSTMQALVTAIYELGCLAGAMYALFAGDKLGRRLMIMHGACVMIIGVTIQICAIKGHGATAQSFVGRFITGIGNGMNTSTIPTYQAECSCSSNRGLLICIEGCIIAIGTMIAYWIDFGASYGPDDLVWRFPIGFQIVFGLIIIIGMYYLPDFPRYLISKGKVHEGEHVLAALGGNEIVFHENQIQKQLVIESINVAGVATGAGYSDLLTGSKTQHLRRMLIGSSSQIAQQLSGCNAVIYYLPVLLKKSLGQDEFMSILIGGINMIVISWGIYLFIAVMNFVFIPPMILFYPETAGRSLEEIDLIFAKGYCENMSYVKASKELPRLTDQEIEAKAAEDGFDSSRRQGDMENSGEREKLLLQHHQR